MAIDGSKFRAVNSKGRNFTQRKLERQIKGLDEKIDKYLEELDEADEEEKDVAKPTAEELREKLEALKGRRARLGEIEQQLKKSDESQVSLTADSRATLAPALQVQVCPSAVGRLRSLATMSSSASTRSTS